MHYEKILIHAHHLHFLFQLFKMHTNRLSVLLEITFSVHTIKHIFNSLLKTGLDAVYNLPRKFMYCLLLLALAKINVIQLA